MESSSPEKLCRRFALAEIQSATGNFSNAHLIGEGGFGKVYKGFIDNGSAIAAVKRLERESRQGRPEFTTEIETLSKLRHRNIVSLIGYCSEQGEMILVYEYIANQTLADHLHNSSQSSLTWTELLNICIAAGRGLDHLHTGSSGSSIIHRDIKSTNILLDEDLVAKVSDFGLAKHLSANSSESHVSASFKGSFGYVDPCFVATGKLTMASDTYAFGVVLLEVVSGRRAYDTSRPAKEWFLSNWAKEKIQMGKAREIVASHLSGEIWKNCLKIFLGIAQRCLHDKPEQRPTMTEVCAQLLEALRLQQERRRPTRRLWPFNASPRRVIPSGSPQEDNNQVGGNMLPQAIQGDALEHDQAVPVIPVDELEDRQNANIVVPSISLAELQEITDDFSSECLIANGSSGGSLFRGVLKTGQVAAIKKLNKKLPDQELLIQVSRISSLQHENVVQPLGYCVNGDLQVLAYEFTPRGSLHDILHGRRPGTTGVAMEPGAALSWVQRIKIAVGAAKGLCHIHENALIHHSIKSSNVLLFEDGNAKISDVCLTTEYPWPCKAARGDEPYPFALRPGCCYHPPQCELTNQTQKGDVYSFGVVLLELLTGRKPFDPTQPLGEQFLAIWAKPMLNVDNIQMIVDARLETNYPLMAVFKMAEVAALCLEKEAESRPDMSTVLRYLNNASWETGTCLQKRQQRSQRV